jgi:excisionase family DNA binding protein
MNGSQLHTPAEAAQLLRVPESWLRKKAAARMIPCTFVGKHLRFSSADLAEIVEAGARQPHQHRETPGRRLREDMTRRG